MKYLIYATVFIIETLLCWVLANIDEKVIFMAVFNWFVNLVIFGLLIEKLFKTQASNKNNITNK